MRRLRWRLEGALQWPLFALLTVVDAALLMVRPITGTGPALVPALLLAMFFNLVAVAVLGRLAARYLRRRRPDLPPMVAEDRAGVTLLVTVTAAIVLGGFLHAGGAADAERALEAQEEAVRAYVAAHGTSQQRENVDAMDTRQHADDFFRTCVPGAPPVCLLVDTSEDPPSVFVDPDRNSN